MALSRLAVLAVETGIPVSNPWSQLGMPLAVLIFVGSVYLLLRSNLGTRRGYLVMSVSLWGFGFLLSLLWTFGAPGTPPNTGPQNLPGTELDAYLPVFRPFAPDSAIAQGEYAFVQSYPEGFEEPPASFQERADEAAAEIQSFFSGLADPYERELLGTEEPVSTLWSPARDGARFQVVAVEYQATCQLNSEGELTGTCAEQGLEVGAPDPSAEPVVYFAFFDPGAEYFPSLLMTAIMVLLFAGHLLALYRDETRERREREELARGTAPAVPQAQEPVGVGRS